MKSYTTNRRLSPVVVLFFGILIASTASILIRFAQQEAASIVIAAYRLTIAALILLPLAIWKHSDELRGLRLKQIVLVILSGIFLSIHFASWITSLEYTSVASSAVLVSTTPLWVALLSPVLLRERPTRMVATGMFIALIGGALVGFADACVVQAGRLGCPGLGSFYQGRSFTGNLLALTGAFSGGLYLLVGRFLRPTMSLVVYIFTVYGMAAVSLVIMALVSRQPLTGFPDYTYLLFLALAVGPQLLGHTSFNYGLRYISAAYVSVALLGEPIGSTLLAMLILKEPPQPLEIIGGGVIMLGIFLASRAQAQITPAPNPSPSG